MEPSSKLCRANPQIRPTEIFTRARNINGIRSRRLPAFDREGMDLFRDEHPPIIVVAPEVDVPTPDVVNFERPRRASLCPLSDPGRRVGTAIKGVSLFGLGENGPLVPAFVSGVLEDDEVPDCFRRVKNVSEGAVGGVGFNGSSEFSVARQWKVVIVGCGWATRHAPLHVRDLTVTCRSEAKSRVSRCDFPLRAGLRRFGCDCVRL